MIFFNRDEMLSRSRARRPKIFSYASGQVIMPIDQDAGGSWLSVNQQGVFIGLLNDYPPIDDNRVASELSRCPQDPLRQPDKPKVSRGKIVKDLAETSCLLQVQDYFSAQDLNQFNPFRLVFICQLEQWQFYWDGQALQLLPLPQFISSSSRSNTAVVGYRQQRFKQLKSINRDKLLALHQQHHASDQGFSLCMHRHDAKTVSLSEIHLTDLNVSYRYWDGSPCQVKPDKPISLTPTLTTTNQVFIQSSKANQKNQTGIIDNKSADSIKNNALVTHYL